MRSSGGCVRLRADGQLFAAYLALYAIGKFALSFRRVETVWLAGLQEAQLRAIAGFAIAAFWAWRSGRGSATGAPRTEPA